MFSFLIKNFNLELLFFPSTVTVHFKNNEEKKMEHMSQGHFKDYWSRTWLFCIRLSNFPVNQVVSQPLVIIWEKRKWMHQKGREYYPPKLYASVVKFMENKKGGKNVCIVQGIKTILFQSSWKRKSTRNLSSVNLIWCYIINTEKNSSESFSSLSILKYDRIITTLSSVMQNISPQDRKIKALNAEAHLECFWTWSMSLIEEEQS